MRFFKSFNLLHRRSKSDSSVPFSKDQRTKRSSSLGQFDNQAFADNAPKTDHVLNSVAPDFVPTFLYPTTIIAANIRILDLESENTHLRNATSTWAVDFAELKLQLKNVQGDLYAALHRDVHHKRQAKADEEEIERLWGGLAQYERFLGLMIDLGQHEHVLGNAHAALRAGQDADQALVDAIKEAAAVSGSAWDNILSAVSSRRTQDEYLSALNLTLNVRKELRECRKVAKFWKRTAQEDSHHAETVTPSVSTISSIQVVLSAERQNAVDALLARYRGCSHGVTEERPHSIPAQPSLDPVTTVNSFFRQLPATPITIDASISNNISSISALTSPYSFSAQSQSYVSELPPLASESFKQELASLSSNKRPFKRSSSSKLRGRVAFGQVDHNVNFTPSVRPSDSADTEAKRFVSIKALGKRRATAGLQNTDSVDVPARLTHRRHPVLPVSFSHSFTTIFSASVAENKADTSLETRNSNTLGDGDNSPFVSDRSLDSHFHGPLEKFAEECKGSSSVTEIPHSQEWSIFKVPEQDASLSFVPKPISTAPITPTKSTSPPMAPMNKSRLPLPVLKHLRTNVVSVVAPLVIEKSARMRIPSRMRLPVLMSRTAKRM